jgi:hypothetical protein
VLPPALELQPDSGLSCNRCTLHVANTKYFRLILSTPWVETRQWIELQLIYTLSCKYWMLTSDTILPLELQPNSGLSCNWYTPESQILSAFVWYCTTPSVATGQWFELQFIYSRVANTKCFRLTLYYPFSCNRTVVRVALDAQSELRILSAFVSYYTTPFSCNPALVRVAIGIHFEL